MERRTFLKLAGAAAIAPALPAIAPTAPKVTYIGEIGSYANIRLVGADVASEPTVSAVSSVFRAMVADAMGKVEHFPRLSDLMNVTSR